MERSKIQDALQNLVNRKFIIRDEEYGHYRFLKAGQEFTNNKSKNTWAGIVWRDKELWVREEPGNNKTWHFVKYNEITKEQFEDFCNYYEISFGPDLYDVDNDVFEDI